ncbi:hypothetical protein, partial [Thiolapillus sp.]|uniref:hypothetical protein n=1 Tax=Thiolapillus sp. TaxID=2017437 RepID=UPI003AF96C1E
MSIDFSCVVKFQEKVCTGSGGENRCGFLGAYTVVAENLLWIFCFANSNNAEAASCEVNSGLWNLLKNQYQP